MWDEQDHFSRWVQGVSGVISLSFGAVVMYDSTLSLLNGDSSYGYYWDGLGLGAVYLAYRCLRYAVTGRDNINRDDF